MNDFCRSVFEKKIERTVKNLEKNNFEVHVLDSKEQVVPAIKSMIPHGATVACGGSFSLSECGVPALLSSGDYNYIDRGRKGITPEEARRAMVEAFGADVYLCSSNAVTEKGELYNVDGNSNRIAAIAFGPKSVIMVVGINKLVKDIPEAVQRVRSVAAPANCARLSCATPCAESGKCKTCKVVDQPSPCGGDDDTGIPVIQRSVDKDSGSTPALALVAAFIHQNLAVRVHMGLTVS